MVIWLDLVNISLSSIIVLEKGKNISNKKYFHSDVSPTLNRMWSVKVENKINNVSGGVVGSFIRLTVT